MRKNCKICGRELNGSSVTYCKNCFAEYMRIKRGGNKRRPRMSKEKISEYKKKWYLKKKSTIKKEKKKIPTKEEKMFYEMFGKMPNSNPKIAARELAQFKRGIEYLNTSMVMTEKERAYNSNKDFRFDAYY
jgi:hypothetical protein